MTGKLSPAQNQIISLLIGVIGTIIVLILFCRFSSYIANIPKPSNSFPVRLVKIAGILTPERLAETTAEIPFKVKNAGVDLLYIRVYEYDQAERAGFVFNSRSKEEKEAINKDEMLGTKLCLIPTASEVPMFVLLEPLKIN